VKNSLKQAWDGMEILREDKPDLILLDVIMPTMDGVSMLKEVRSNPEYNAIPIIILSNLNPNDEVLYLVARSQPAYYLIKSETKLEALLAKVKSILKL
jgi:CheY-like chemotaxis protein